MNQINRRKLLKSLVALPLVSSGIAQAAYSSDSVSEKFGHKFKLSLNVYSFNTLLREQKISLFDVLDFCAEYNFDAIDPTGYYFPGYPNVPDDEYIAKFKKHAFLLGIEISGTGIRNDFANPDKESREAEIKLIEQWVVAAAKLGAPNLRVFTGRNKHEGFSRDEVFEWMARDLTRCCEIGKKYGVMIALQNHSEFLKTADDVNRLIKMVDSEWLGLNLDIGNYREHNTYDEIRKNIKHAVTWQIKENVWLNGEKVPTDFERLFTIIKQESYRGYLPLETLGPGDPYQKVPALLQQVQSALRAI